MLRLKSENALNNDENNVYSQLFQTNATMREHQKVLHLAMPAYHCSLFICESCDSTREHRHVW